MRRKKYSSEFKSKVALEVLKGDRTINEIASQFDVHPNQIGMWKKQLKEALPEIFSARSHKAERDWEKLEAQLYQEIGRLKVELDWLKKKVYTDR
jgi:transposase-like protein